MKNILDKVREFQVASDQLVNDKPSLGGELYEVLLRYELMKEENEEYLDAVHDHDKVAQLDACADMLYILAGTINQHGFQDKIEEALERVHANNMTKVIDGKVIRNEHGKILKPEGFQPVDLTDLVN